MRNRQPSRVTQRNPEGAPTRRPPELPAEHSGSDWSLEPQRLQVVLARAGVASRRAAEQFIAAGRVRVDGRIVRELGTRVTSGQRVAFDGCVVCAEPQCYVLLHKPRAVMCTMADPQGRRTVADCLHAVSARVVPVGRLDYHTSGALLMTNDGALSRALLHPSQKVAKRYELAVQGRVDAQRMAILRGSVLIGGRATQPAEVQLLRRQPRGASFGIVLHEGRNRQIRRLAEAAGLTVQRLVRTHFAGLSLEGLESGAFRLLSPPEVQRLKRLHQAAGST